jgi:hypothetical protein
MGASPKTPRPLSRVESEQEGSLGPTAHNSDGHPVMAIGGFFMADGQDESSIR